MMETKQTAAKSFHRVLADHARMRPDNVFVHGIEQDKSLTFRALYALSNRFAHFLEEHDLGANDRVLLLAENSVEFLAMFAATLRYGATIATVHVEMNHAHLAEIVAAIAPKIVLYQEGLGLESIVAGLPGGKFRLGEWQEGRSQRGGGSTGIFGEIEKYSDRDDVESCAGPDDQGVIFYTSGTVAKPKGVIQTHATAWYNYDATADYLEIGPGDKVFDCRSYSWLSAQHMSLGAPLVSGATCVMAKHFSRSNYFDWLKDHDINVGFVVPTIVNMLLNEPVPVTGEDLPHLRFLTSSSAPLLDEQWRAFEEKYGIVLAQSAGSSEGGNSAAHRGADRTIGTIGRPLKYQDIFVIDGDGNRLPDGETGEIIFGGGKQQACGYLMPDGSIERLPEDGHHSGDLGFIDADGNLHITGRVKELIIRGGMNIAPLEIDAVLVRHPAVAEAGAVGVPHPIYGEEVVAFVACLPGMSPSAEVMLNHCRGALPEAKMPKEIIFIDSLPKNSRGKLDRNALADLWKRDNPQTA
jgi:acyl-coenzyme A synthetase/AMP-(fatty) acid ligase